MLQLKYNIILHFIMQNSAMLFLRKNIIFKIHSLLLKKLQNYLEELVNRDLIFHLQKKIQESAESMQQYQKGTKPKEQKLAFTESDKSEITNSSVMSVDVTGAEFLDKNKPMIGEIQMKVC